MIASAKRLKRSNHTLQSITALQLWDDHGPSLLRRLPLWVITYWQGAHKVCQSCSRWEACLKWLEVWTRGTVAGREMEWKVGTVLARLVWNNDLCSSDMGWGSVDELVPLLSNEWLTGAHICQFTALLHRCLLLSSVMDTIKRILEEMRTAQITLDLVAIRGIMVGCITHLALEIFEHKSKNGTRFRCSETFVRRFLKHDMRWSLQRCTRAAHKIPKNVDQVLWKMFLRVAKTLCNESIPEPFCINSDQTQAQFSAGAVLTYDMIGAKQVAGQGLDKKRAFTLMVSISMSGEVLPFQAIFTGQDPKRSLPSHDTPLHDTAHELGFRLEVSKTKTYWSTQQTMQNYVTFVLAPYFDRHKEMLCCPE